MQCWRYGCSYRPSSGGTPTLKRRMHGSVGFTALIFALGGLVGLELGPVCQRPARRLAGDLTARGPHPEPADGPEQRARRDRSHRVRVDAELATRSAIAATTRAPGAARVRLENLDRGSERILSPAVRCGRKSTGLSRTNAVISRHGACMSRVRVCSDAALSRPAPCSMVIDRRVRHRRHRVCLERGCGRSGVAAATVGFCSGQYADDFSSLSAAARDFDHRPEATFSYCTRNTAVYECLSYASDGAVRRDRRKVVAHGTAFAYRKQAGETLLLTNEHVAAWPAVTDGEHEVHGVPAGCKRVSDTLSLVDDENDRYGKDDIPAHARRHGSAARRRRRQGARGTAGHALEGRS